MKFGPVPVAQALGGIVAHSIRAGDFTLRKGTVVTAAHLADLKQHGIADIVVALLDASDLGENEAAGQLAAALAGEGARVEPPFTGRANLFASHAGLLVIDRAAIDAVNAIDEAITIATLAPMKHVSAGEMVATVKIIPFAVDGALVVQAAAKARAALHVAPYRARRIGVVSTLLPGLKASVVYKTLKVMRERLQQLGTGAIAFDQRVAHETAAIAQALEAMLAPSSSARPPSRTGAMSFRPPSRLAAVASSIWACRSIRAICCWSETCMACRSLALRVARAAPRRTGLTGCCSGCWPTCRCARLTFRRWARVAC
jgi:molybdenum cofactor cytidylyltransferase